MSVRKSLSSKDFFWMKTLPKTRNVHHKDIRNKVNNFLKNTSGCNSVPKISANEVLKKIAAFSSQFPFSSPGLNGLFPVLIQWVLDSLAMPPSNSFPILHSNSIFSWCLEKRTTPNHPKPNNPDKTSYKSQRPITLLPIIGNGFEKILLERFLFLSPGPETNGFTSHNLASEPTTAPT